MSDAGLLTPNRNETTGVIEEFRELAFGPRACGDGATRPSDRQLGSRTASANESEEAA